jgi:predicted kinase
MEIVLMVGLPSSGKTTYAKENYPSYTFVSLDEIPRHNRKLELELVEENLLKENSVVIADTNATREVRVEYVKLAKKFGAKLITVYIDYPSHFFAYHKFDGTRVPSWFYFWAHF